MAIKDLQKRLTQVGVIRLGEQRVASSGKKYPAKLETLRFTSASRSMVEAIAAAYGGQVKPWQANTGPQWEVVTGVNEVPVLVPPQRIDPNLEHWGNGFRDRHCDGEIETIRNTPCLCAAAQLAGKPFAPRDMCKPTTRMSLMLANMPGIGTFKLESHGWNAAAELPMLAEAIEKAPEPIPAQLVVEVREKKLFHPGKPQKDQIESRVYMVPVLHFNWVTPAQVFGGEIGSAAHAALSGASAERRAIEAAKLESERRKFTAEEYLQLAESAEEIDDTRELWTDAAHDGALTDEVKAALHERVAAIKARDTAQAEPEAAEQVTTPPVAAAEDVVDAEVVPDADAVWAQIQVLAGAHKWSADDLERRVQEYLKKSSDLADGFELTKFHDAVKSGEIA